jgi:site-specific DNA recombinase
MVLLEEFERAGCRVEFLDPPPGDTPHEHLLLQIRGAVAEYERTLIGERMRRGRLARYRAGLLLPWTQPVYGYLLDPEHPRDPNKGVRVNEAQAAVVRQLFAWYLEDGASLSGIVNRLFEHGVTSPTGKARWRQTTVRFLLRNPAYTGTLYACRTRTRQSLGRRSALQPIGKRHDGSMAPRPREEWVAPAQSRLSLFRSNMIWWSRSLSVTGSSLRATTQRTTTRLARAGQLRPLRAGGDGAHGRGRL